MQTVDFLVRAACDAGRAPRVELRSAGNAFTDMSSHVFLDGEARIRAFVSRRDGRRRRSCALAPQEHTQHLPAAGTAKVMEFTLVAVHDASGGDAIRKSMENFFSGRSQRIPSTTWRFKRVREARARPAAGGRAVLWARRRARRRISQDKQQPNGTEVYVNTVAAFMGKVWEEALIPRIRSLCAPRS